MITEIKNNPGSRVEKEKETNILKCYGRINGNNPTYLEMELFTVKLITNSHREIMHFAVADTLTINSMPLTAAHLPKVAVES